MDFLDALEAFRDMMRVQFIAAETRHPENQAVATMNPLKMDPGVLWEHLIDEYHELEDRPSSQHEQVDLANMSFLLWWQQEELGLAGRQCSYGNGTVDQCRELAYGRCNACREIFCEGCFDDHLHTTIESESHA